MTNSELAGAVLGTIIKIGLVIWIALDLFNGNVLNAFQCFYVVLLMVMSVKGSIESFEVK